MARRTILTASEAMMRKGLILGLMALLAGCVEQIPGADLFLDHQDAGADAAAGTDAESGTDATPGTDAVVDSADVQPDAATDAAEAAIADADAAAPDAETQGDAATDAAVPDAMPDGGTDAATADVTSDAATDAVTADVAADADAAADAVTCVAAACDDKNVCTDDTCDASGACVHLANAATCSDGNACTEGDVCAATSCSSGVTATCDDGQLCTTDSCDPATGCAHAANALTCDDGNPCTVGDVCSGGTCKPGVGSLNCDDQNPCTTDACAASGCTHSNNTSPCNDGNACTQVDTCKDGGCSGASPVICDQPDQCHTTGTCDTGTGVCSNPAKSNGAACSDGNACTQTDTCQSGTCTGSNAVACPTPDPCHVIGICDTGTGICAAAANKINGSACTDGNACTLSDTCQSGICTAGTAKICTASDDCHVAGTCDPNSGTCSNPATTDGVACSDGTACTSSDACKSGVCVGIPMLWSKNFSNAINAIVAMPDGGAMAVTGSATSSTQLVRVDSFGNTLWSKTYGTGTQQLSSGIVNGPLAAFYGVDTGNGNGWFLAVNLADGSTAADVVETVGSGVNVTGIAINGSGYAVVCGGTMAMLDGAGKIKSSRSFTSPDVSNNLIELRQLSSNSDGGWTISGRLHADSGLSSLGYVARLDSQGNPMWSKSFADGNLTSRVVGAVMLPDGSFNVLNRGNSVFTPNGYGSGWSVLLHRLASDGTELSLRLVNKLTKDEIPVGFVPLADGFALAGSDGSATGFYAIRADLAGNALWETNLSGPAGSLNAITATSNGFWLGGSQTVGGINGGYLARIDAYGNATCTVSGDCATKTLSACSDNNLCTNDACSGGACSHTNLSAGAGCDDGNACTLDTCDASGGCKHVNDSDGLACEDGSVCTLSDTCKAGLCAAGVKSTFSHAMGFDYYAGLQGVAVNGSGYAFAGRAHGADNLWMVVTDRGGTILNGVQGNVVDLGAFDELHDVVAAGSGWTFAGNTGVDMTHTDGLLYAVAADGVTMLWKKTFGGTGEDDLHAIAMRPSGYVMCGQSNSPGVGGNTNFWLETTDLSGNNATSHYYDYAGTWYERCAGVIVAANGDLVLSGSADNGGWVVRTDANGTKIWDKFIGGTYNSTTGFGTSWGRIVEVAGTLYVSGSYVSSSTATSKVWLAALSADGNLLWQKTYGSTADDFGSGIAATGDGLLIAGATTGFGAPAREGYVVRTDFNGNLLWQNAIPRPGDTANATGTCALSAVATATDGFVLAGSDDIAGWGDGWIVKLDNWGNVTCGDSGSCGGQKVSFCDDSNPCTADTCSTANANLCNHTNLGDGTVCGSAKTCSAGVCQ